jgi:cell division septum initiation protein DivIVA
VVSGAAGSVDGTAVPGAKLPVLEGLVTAPAFRVAFRGYDAGQVDRYARLVEAELRAAKLAQRELAADVRSLADQIDRAHEELAVLRRRPSVDDAVAFRHLGPRVEQILAEAHAEADEIRAAASRSAEELRTSSAEQLQAVRAEHDRAVAEFEQRRSWLREEEERWTRLLRSRQEQVTRAEHYRHKVQEGAEEILASATLQHQRVVASALARSEEILAQAAAQADQIRDAARRAPTAE